MDQHVHLNLKNIVFDLGGVLIDWNPRHLFTEVFQNHDELEFFLTEICSDEWNEEQDAGRSLAEGTRILTERYPAYRKEIEMYYGKWEKMLRGPIQANVDIFQTLVQKGCYGLFALTNWSGETFPVALDRFPFLHDFENILVSGLEGMRKPQPEFFQLMFDRFKIIPDETLFIDDNLRNIKAAQNMGIRTVHLPPGTSLIWHLEKYGINTLN
jgi:2-haloacid dehalogenase